MHIPKVNLKNYISSVKTQKYSGGSMLASNMAQIILNEKSSSLKLTPKYLEKVKHQAFIEKVLEILRSPNKIVELNK